MKNTISGLKSDELLACQTCGTTLKKVTDNQSACPTCKDHAWTAAVL